MKIQFISDLHLERKDNLRYMTDFKIPVTGDVLILAGDIIELRDSFEEHWFFKYCSDNFALTLWVPGNHEYYHNSMLNKYGNSCNINIKDNVILLNNNVYKYQDVNFILTTLWSKIPQYKYINLHRNIEDFSRTRYGFSDYHFNDKFLTCEDVNELFNYSFASLDLFLSNLNKEDKIVVVSHTLPSTICNAAEFKGSYINEFFCVDLSNYIIDTDKIDYWIYGHSHRNVEEKQLGRTKLVCNQLGYVNFGEWEKFQGDKIITI